MPANRIRARPPRQGVRRPAVLEAPDAVASYLHDAARTPGGHCPLVLLPSSEGELAWAVRHAPRLLAVGAQSSLTGGATPFGEWLLSTARLDAIGPVRGQRVTVQAGVALVTLRQALRGSGLFFPPTPTYDGAFVGGAAATNAAGAATFKYGSTRDWVAGLTVLLADGSVLELVRGACRADAQGSFEIERPQGEPLRPRVPSYRMPDVPKRSAGYYAEPGMDLVDLFVGSEGTLGVISEVELRVAPEPARLLGWLSLGSEAGALALTAALRDAARAAWRSGGRDGLDVASIESLDRRSLALLVEAGAERRAGLKLAPDADAALLFAVELPAGGGAEAAEASLARLAELLAGHARPEELAVALPGDLRRAEQLESLREAVPLLVNARVEAAQHADPLVHKVAADMVVPFERLGEAMALYREGFARRGLDHALWGHVSDGNVHANAIPRSAADVRSGQAAILEFGERVIAMGGCPMSEHGVGRNPVKQTLLQRLYGDSGVAEMRALKAALDPGWKLAPGVLLAPATGPSR